VVRFPHVPFTPRQHSSRYPFNRRLRWPQGYYGGFGGEKLSGRAEHSSLIAVPPSSYLNPYSDLLLLAVGRFLGCPSLNLVTMSAALFSLTLSHAKAQGSFSTILSTTPSAYVLLLCERSFSHSFKKKGRQIILLHV
jgi:hypothetical protein